MELIASAMRLEYNVLSGEILDSLFSRNNIMVIRHTKLRRCRSLVLIGFIICSLFMQNGYCDNRKSSKSQKHSHSSSAVTYKPPDSPIKWNNWTSSTSTSKSTISDAPSSWNNYDSPVNVVPLTLEEYQKRVANNDNKNIVKKGTSVKSSVSMSKGSKLHTESSKAKPMPAASMKSSAIFEDLDNHVKIEVDEEEKDKDKAFSPDTPIDLDFIKSKALSFGKMVIDHFTKGGGIGSNGGMGMGTSRHMRSIFLDPNINRQDSEGEGKSRGVVEWLARLIGVQGKTLGEFLREYQVHVLYDLAFTFFKWIFFLYAGLLIP